MLIILKYKAHLNKTNTEKIENIKMKYFKI